MVSTIALQISMISYGNDAILSGSTDDDYPSNSIFKFCRKVQFVDIITAEGAPKPKGKVIAANPNQWFEYMAGRGCTRLKLLYLPPKKSQNFEPYHTAGFISEAKHWLIEAVFDDCSEYWTSNWKLTHKNDPDKKIWTVSLAKMDYYKKSRDKQYDMQKIRQEFVEILDDVKTLANTNGLEKWGKTFDKAIDTLSSSSPESGYYHKELIKTQNYDLAARQLVFGAAMAWVFGGMGWWNDVGFRDEEANKKHGVRTPRLFDIICKALSAAVNSYKIT